MSSRGGAEPSLQRRLTRTQTVGNIGESIFDSEVVPSSLVEIAPILRVANEVEPSNPRVAYLCKHLCSGFINASVIFWFTCNCFLQIGAWWIYLLCKVLVLIFKVAAFIICIAVGRWCFLSNCCRWICQDYEILDFTGNLRFSF